MSFLLDALRKSEKQRRKGVVPDIHSGFEPPEYKQGRLNWNYIMVPAVGILIVLIWFGWRRDVAPAEVVVSRGVQPAAKVTVEEPAVQDPSPVLPEIPRRMDASEVIKPGRTAVEQYAGSADNASGEVGRPKRVNSTVPEDTLPSVANAAAEAGALPGQEEDDDALSLPSVDIPNQRDTASQTFQPGLISYWQLPEYVREELPAFNISVIVFAKDSKDRFMLLNGARLVEGDEPQPDLVLQEIRRGGAVFSYRLYQFLVTQ